MERKIDLAAFLAGNYELSLKEARRLIQVYGQDNLADVPFALRVKLYRHTDTLPTIIAGYVPDWRREVLRRCYVVIGDNIALKRMQRNDTRTWNRMTRGQR
jgi:hypothetical protein